MIGPVTLTAIEALLDRQLGKAPESPRMTCSLVGLNRLVEFEISSDVYYSRFLKHPIWPGGASGITIGIGYDLGYCSASQMRTDWRGHILDDELAALEDACRLKGNDAKTKLEEQSIREVTVELAGARQVFYCASLPAYAAKCLAAYPGVEQLPADAQAAMLSLVYNRGTAKSGSRRKEMMAIEPLIAAGDLPGIADQITGMKRLWEGKGLDGLLTRRDQEAALVLGAERTYQTDELVRI
jgi:GH24 family phage-related lysozyme (muramidase)